MFKMMASFSHGHREGGTLYRGPWPEEGPMKTCGTILQGKYAFWKT